MKGHQAGQKRGRGRRKNTAYGKGNRGMRLPWHFSEVWNKLRDSWRVPPRGRQREELAAQLFLRPLEERRVLTASVMAQMALESVAGPAGNLDSGSKASTEVAKPTKVDAAGAASRAVISNPTASRAIANQPATDAANNSATQSVERCRRRHARGGIQPARQFPRALGHARSTDGRRVAAFDHRHRTVQPVRWRC